MRGIFITLEGPDGCGKTTIAQMIYDKLKLDYEIVRTREPGGTKISEKIRELILSNDNIEMTNRTEALLYAAARAQHVEEKIIPEIEKGKIVLCERFVLSSLVYQGMGRNLGVENIRKINEFATGGLKPDVVFLFDVKDFDSNNRKLKLGGDRLENTGLDFHETIRKSYKKLQEIEDCYVIDATKNIDKVFQTCFSILDKKLKEEL